MCGDIVYNSDQGPKPRNSRRPFLNWRLPSDVGWLAIGFGICGCAKDTCGTISTCKANKSALNVAFRLYANDNDGRLTPAPLWMDSLAPYASPDVFHCAAMPVGSFG